MTRLCWIFLFAAHPDAINFIFLPKLQICVAKLPNLLSKVPSDLCPAHWDDQFSVFIVLGLSTDLTPQMTPFLLFFIFLDHFNHLFLVVVLNSLLLCQIHQHLIWPLSCMKRAFCCLKFIFHPLFIAIKLHCYINVILHRKCLLNLKVC